MRDTIHDTKEDLEAIRRQMNSAAQNLNTGVYGEEIKMHRDDIINYRSNTSQTRQKTNDQ